MVLQFEACPGSGFLFDPSMGGGILGLLSTELRGPQESPTVLIRFPNTDIVSDTSSIPQRDIGYFVLSITQGFECGFLLGEILQSRSGKHDIPKNRTT